MRTLILVFLFLTSFNHYSQTTEEETCVRKSLPDSFEKLNNFAPLVYKLSDDCSYQPIHIEISQKTSFTIIGRFSGQKINASQFRLEAIEFAFYEATKAQKPIVVKKAWAELEKKEGMTIVNIELEDLSKCKSSRCKALKDQKKKGAPDYTAENLGIVLNSDDILDFHLVNLEEVFPQLPKDVFPKGRHCNGSVTF